MRRNGVRAIQTTTIGAWLPWVGAGLVLAIAGAALGASGAFGAPRAAGVAPHLGSAISQTTSGLDCPGGAQVAAFAPGERVFAVARSDDSAYLGVRSPFDRDETVWVPRSAVAVDPGEPAASTLPVDGCPVPVVTVAPLSPEPATEPEAPEQQPQPPRQPQPQPRPQPPTPDTAPSLGTPSGVQNVGCTAAFGPETTTIAVPANDDHGVEAVTVSWSGVDSGTAELTRSGASWTFRYDPPDVIGTVTFTLVAHDTAGHASAPATFTVTVNCLI